MPMYTISNGSDSKKKSACSAADPGSIPGLGRSPGEENGYPLQYSCLKNSKDRGWADYSPMGLQTIMLDWGTNIFIKLFQIFVGVTHTCFKLLFIILNWFYMYLKKIVIYCVRVVTGDYQVF